MPDDWRDPLIDSWDGSRASCTSNGRAGATPGVAVFGLDPRSLGDVVRKVDISHSGQTVSEAMEQLIGEIEAVRRGGDRVLLVVHGFGASGVGGAIKEAMVTELPGLARRYGFKTYGHSDKDRLSRQQNVNARFLNPGSTLLIFPEVGLDREAKQDFRPNFRNLRSKVRTRRRP